MYVIGPLDSITTPHGVARGHRALRYLLAAQGRTSCVRPSPAVGDGPALLTCADPPADLLADLRADPALSIIPSPGASLADLSLRDLADLRQALRPLFDLESVVASMAQTPRDLMRAAHRLLLAQQRLGADYPVVAPDSTLTLGALSPARRAALEHVARSGGVDISAWGASTRIRDALAHIARDCHERVDLPEQDASYSDDFSGDLSAWTQDSGTWTITGGTLRQTATGSAWRKLRYTAAMDTADYTIQADARSGSLMFGAGVGGRMTADAAVTYYGWAIFGGDSAYLVEITAGAETVLATGSGITASTTYTIRLRCEGSALAGYLNGALDASASDASLTAGRVGCISHSQIDSANDWLDNWSAQDLTATGGRRRPLVYTDHRFTAVM